MFLKEQNLSARLQQRKSTVSSCIPFRSCIRVRKPSLLHVSGHFAACALLCQLLHVRCLSASQNCRIPNLQRSRKQLSQYPQTPLKPHSRSRFRAFTGGTRPPLTPPSCVPASTTPTIGTATPPLRTCWRAMMQPSTLRVSNSSRRRRRTPSLRQWRTRKALFGR